MKNQCDRVGAHGAGEATQGGACSACFKVSDSMLETTKSGVVLFLWVGRQGERSTQEV